MSVMQLVVLRDSEVPTRQEWQNSIADAGCDLQLDLTFDPREQSGYLPVALNGEDTAFEYDFVRPEDVEFDTPPPDFGGRDRVIALVTRGDMRGCAAATCAAAALTRLV